MDSETILSGCGFAFMGFIFLMWILFKVAEKSNENDRDWLRNRGWSVSSWFNGDAGECGTECKKGDVFFSKKTWWQGGDNYPIEPVKLAIAYEKKHGANSELIARLNKELSRLVDEARMIARMNRHRIEGTGVKAVDNSQYERIMKRIEKIKQEIKDLNKFK